jgi:hypothetical protein
MRSAQSKFTLAVMLTIGVIIASGGFSPAAKRPKPSKTEKPVTADEFQLLHRKLIKMSDQRVWSIPWQLSVRKAREIAAKQRKPVFLWISSNGGTHPLGPC